MLLGQLKANNAQLMEEAVQAMQNLAQQCSDPTAVQDVVTHLFKILGGEHPVACWTKIVIYGVAHLMQNLLWLQDLRENSQSLPRR